MKINLLHSFKELSPGRLDHSLFDAPTYPEIGDSSFRCAL